MLRSDLVYLQKVFRIYIRPYKVLLILAFVLMVVVALTTSIYAYLMKNALDKIFVNKDVLMLSLIPFAIILVSAIKNIAYYFQTTIMNVTLEKIATRIRNDLYTKFIYSDIETFSKKPSSHMIANMVYDVDALIVGLNMIITTFVREVLTIVFLIGMLIYQNPTLTFLSFISVPLIIFPMIKISKYIRSLSQTGQHSLESFIAKMDDALKSPKLVKAYTAEGFEIARMNSILSGMLSLKKKVIRVSKISAPLNEFLGVLGFAAVIWYGGYQVIEGKSTTGEFFGFFAAMILAYRPLKSLSGINMTIQNFFVTNKRIFDLLESDLIIKDKPNARVLDSVKGEIIFENVSFKYPETDKQVLYDINFTVKSGQIVALVGPTGAGKSTVLSVLLRFYNLDAGRVLLDGIDIKDISLQSLRRSISYVSQDIQLLDDTVENNIKYSTQSATHEEIVRAAIVANAHEFIEKLPNGYQTQIGQSGLRLSGGQKQRLAIARAIVYNAPILILDEATSALDSISEKLIKDALAKIMKDKTTIVIAHRLSTVLHANEILVIENGTVTERGTHTELINQGGHYSKLYATQFYVEDERKE